MACAQAQDSCLIKAITFYAENILPGSRPGLLSAKQELHAAASGPEAVSYNLDLADVCAALFEFDSAMYFIGRELDHRDISKDLTDYKMLFLFMKDPGTWKRFTDSVYFGRYNTDKVSGYKRYVRSGLCMQYIERQLLHAPVFFGWGLNYRYKNIPPMSQEEGQRLSAGMRQVKQYLEQYLQETGQTDYVKVRLPQYSKDGTVPVSAVIKGMTSASWLLRDLVADKTTEIETLLEKKELPNLICYWVDDYLLKQDKPQRYGTHMTEQHEKIVVQSPHDNIKEIAARRKLAGLNTLQEMIRDEEKERKEWQKGQLLPN